MKFKSNSIKVKIVSIYIIYILLINLIFYRYATSNSLYQNSYFISTSILIFYVHVFSSTFYSFILLLYLEYYMPFFFIEHSKNNTYISGFMITLNCFFELQHVINHYTFLRITLIQY